MNAPRISSADIAIPAEFQTRFDAQRAAYLAAPEPAHAERVADLKALSRLDQRKPVGDRRGDQRRLRQSQRIRDAVRRGLSGASRHSRRRKRG